MPQINIKELLDASVDALKQAALPHIPEAAGALSFYIIQNSERLAGLADPDLDPEYVKERLALEGDILTSQLASFEVFGQRLAKDAQDATVQSIITTFLTILTKFITAA